MSVKRGGMYAIWVFIFALIALFAISNPDMGIKIDIYFYYLLMLVSGLGTMHYLSEAKRVVEEGTMQQAWILVACGAVLAVVLVFANFDIPNALSTYR